MLAFFLYVLLMSLYGEIILEKHRNVWHIIAGMVAGVLPVVKEKAQGPIDQIIEIGNAIYRKSLIERLQD
jgi:hypothetical protein